MITENIKKIQDYKSNMFLNSKRKELIKDHLDYLVDTLEKLDDQSLISFLLSEENNKIRKNLYGNTDTGVIVNEGDIVFCDFGNAYQLEVGNQHLAIVSKIIKNKVFVVPFTSSEKAWKHAINNPCLMRVRKSKYLLKKSTLYLNDCKFINSSRIIDVRGKISKNELLKIKEKIKEILL